MSRNKPSSHRVRVKKYIKNLSPVHKRLRKGLQLDAARLITLAIIGARAVDWLKAQKAKDKPRPKQSRGHNHLPIDPAPVPRNHGKVYDSGPKSLDHIPPAERDDARLELLRASFKGKEAFEAKRLELMKLFSIDRKKHRNLIMGAFWSHTSGHRRKGFVSRLLAREPSIRRRKGLLYELAKLYRVEPEKLEAEAGY